ncbi:MAG: esterase family protein, partial [Actinomycetota bacterium]|nr:esterase family protein [Actinomycetota bacterium]
MAAVIVGTVGTAAPLGAEPKTLDAAQDNPPGCTTASAEEDDGCGAQGRDHFGDASHKAPIEACADVRSPAGSVVTRIIPDGPRRADGTLAFTSGVCIYLPPGYESSQLRYPVLYLLHGGGGDQGNWVTNGNLQATLDARIAADPRDAVIAVLPDGRSGQWYDSFDGRFLIERYVLDHLLPYVDARLRTIPDRSARAIAGLSNGGYGAMHFAARRPDAFVAAGAMSSNMGAYGFKLGNQVNGPAYYPGHLPEELAINLDGVDLTMDIGASCTSDLTVDLCATLAVDAAFIPANRAFTDRLRAVGHVGDLEYRETEGSHAWRWWTAWLRDRHLPFLLARLRDPAADATPTSPLPASFRYRTIADRFSVWGYDVEVTRGVREFLDLTNVTESGLTVQGSGTVVVTTATRYEPGSRYRVSGTGVDPFVLTSDELGRLRLPIGLGPSHANEQYSPAARAA